MPVNVLYCEGNPGSVDIRVLRQIIPRDCEIQPIGSKKNFGTSIIGDRALNPNLACLADRDFDCCDLVITDRLRQCFAPNKIQIGWTWERKEIENYLLAPVVVRRALGKKSPPLDEYEHTLQEIVNELSTYTAARTALSCYGFKNFWGEQVGKSHFLPDRLGRDACEQNIRTLVEQFKSNRIVKSDDVISKFRKLLPSFRSEGIRNQNYLVFFSGKDLLFKMMNKLKDFGFESSDPSIKPTDVFVERLIGGLEKAEEIWTWLPEWKNIRQLITETNF